MLPSRALSRPLLRRLAAWLVVTLLFAQWATASYACPRLANPAAAAATVHPPGCTMPAGEMDPDQPQLCKAHCEQGTQTPAQAALDVPVGAFTLHAVLDWRAQAVDVPRDTLRHVDIGARAPPGSPPLYIVLQVLRP